MQEDLKLRKGAVNFFLNERRDQGNNQWHLLRNLITRPSHCNSGCIPLNQGVPRQSLIMPFEKGKFVMALFIRVEVKSGDS